MTFTLRPLAAGDLDAVLAIAAASPEAPVWRCPDYALFLPSALPLNPNLRRVGLVADAVPGAASVLGFACATLLLDGQENRAEVDTVAVLPAARRLGIGAALLRALLAWAAAEGARHLSLEVRPSNAAAVALYTRLGFRTEGRRPRYYADPEEDALLLSREVTPVSSFGSFSTENSVEGGPPQC